LQHPFVVKLDDVAVAAGLSNPYGREFGLCLCQSCSKSLDLQRLSFSV
jgi:hypothetical protein